jgi:hypothetical protein
MERTSRERDGRKPLTVRRVRFSVRTRALVIASSTLCACAAAPPPAIPESPPPSAFGPAGSREVGPVDQEMLSIGKAEAELDQLVSPARRPTAGPQKKDGKEGEKPADRSIERDADDGAGRALPNGDGCAIACKALGSMATSADRLCRLAGENDGRCDDARARVRGATARVKAACPTCSVAVPAAPLRPQGPALTPPLEGPPAGMPPGMPPKS